MWRLVSSIPQMSPILTVVFLRVYEEKQQMYKLRWTSLDHYWIIWIANTVQPQSQIDSPVSPIAKIEIKSPQVDVGDTRVGHKFLASRISLVNKITKWNLEWPFPSNSNKIWWLSTLRGNRVKRSWPRSCQLFLCDEWDASMVQSVRADRSEFFILRTSQGLKTWRELLRRDIWAGAAITGLEQRSLGGIWSLINRTSRSDRANPSRIVGVQNKSSTTFYHFSSRLVFFSIQTVGSMRRRCSYAWSQCQKRRLSRFQDLDTFFARHNFSR